MLPLWQSIDKVLDTEQESQEIPLALSGNWKTIINLMSSAKDRTILQFVLGVIYSHTQLRFMFGYSSKTANKMNREVQEFISQSRIKAQECECLSEEEFSTKNMKLTNSIHKSEGLLKRKRRNLSVEHVNDREFDIDMKKRRLVSMQHRATHVKNNWQRNIFLNGKDH